MKSPGEIIRERMENRRLTVTDVARMIGCTRPTVYAIIRGKEISPWIAAGLGRVLEINGEDLLCYQASWRWACYHENSETHQPIGGNLDDE